MLLEGSCHCGSVRFSVESHAPCPFMLCYCTICRKVGGGGGYAINIMGEAPSLKIEGEDAIGDYRVKGTDGQGEPLTTAHRFFCKNCGTALWAANEHHPDWIYPFASAIDTALPEAPERIHMMLDSAAPWVVAPEGEHDHHVAQYPDESLEGWHRKHGLFVD